VDGPHRHINRLLAIGFRLSRSRLAPLSRGVDLLVRIMFSADIPSRMSIPTGVTFFHNGLGTVVDERVVFKGEALIMQGTTLGFSIVGRPGVPTIGNRVVIGAGATVVGEIQIGDNCLIGAGVVVARDLPPGHKLIPEPGVLGEIDPLRWREIWSE
jgi:serine O-acetyltransferase